MTSIALIFPHTRLTAALAPLTLIFQPALLRPVAGVSGCSLPDYPCQAIEAPPLGEHLPRFMSLVADITAKGAAEGMSRLLLGARGPKPFDDDENSRRLAAGIMATHDSQAKGGVSDGATRSEALLWDQRLLLTLAEFVDDEEAGINDKLRRLDDRYRQMLAGLRGDEPVLPLTAMPPPVQHITARLKAWSHLYAASESEAIAVWACVAAAADELFEMRTAKGGQAAAELAEIALPARLDPAAQAGGDGGQSHIDQNSASRERVEMAEIAGQLTTLLAQKKPTPDDLRTFSDAWRQKLEQYFPGGHAGASRGRLRLYDLGDLPAGAILGAQGQLAAAGRFLAVWQPGT